MIPIYMLQSSDQYMQLHRKVGQGKIIVFLFETACFLKVTCVSHEDVS